jgi:hypothetical protein
MLRYILLVTTAGLAVTACGSSNMIVLSSRGDQGRPQFISGRAISASDSRAALLAAFRKASEQAGAACQPALIDGLIGSNLQIPTSIPQLVDNSEISIVAVVDRITPLWSIDEHRVRTLLALRITEILSDHKGALRTGEETYALIDGGNLTINDATLCTSNRQLDSVNAGDKLFIAGMIRPLFRRGGDHQDLPVVLGTLLHTDGVNVQLVLPLTNKGTFNFPLAELRKRSKQ